MGFIDVAQCHLILQAFGKTNHTKSNYSVVLVSGSKRDFAEVLRTTKVKFSCVDKARLMIVSCYVFKVTHSKE